MYICIFMIIEFSFVHNYFISIIVVYLSFFLHAQLVPQIIHNYLCRINFHFLPTVYAANRVPVPRSTKATPLYSSTSSRRWNAI